MKYGALLIDPPWAFRTYQRADAIPQRAAVQHYPSMSLDELKALPVPDLAAKDCALFMWVIGSHMEQAIELGKSWGFAIKTDVFIWDKGERCGMGYWSRKQGEQVWLFTRGKPARRSKAVRQFIRSPRREHSRKPDDIYTNIEALVDGPYLEMFARQRRQGWDAWGNEVDKFEAAA